ncbi:MAG: hypothetical protein M1830_002453, partial [Pleopsidium flavum]
HTHQMLVTYKEKKKGRVVEQVWETVEEVQRELLKTGTALTDVKLGRHGNSIIGISRVRDRPLMGAAGAGAGADPGGGGRSGWKTGVRARS